MNPSVVLNTTGDEVSKEHLRRRDWLEVSFGLLRVSEEQTSEHRGFDALCYVGTVAQSAFGAPGAVDMQ